MAGEEGFEPSAYGFGDDRPMVISVKYTWIFFAHNLKMYQLCTIFKEWTCVRYTYLSSHRKLSDRRRIGVRSGCLESFLSAWFHTLCSYCSLLLIGYHLLSTADLCHISILTPILCNENNTVFFTKQNISGLIMGLPKGAAPKFIEGVTLPVRIYF